MRWGSRLCGHRADVRSGRSGSLEAPWFRASYGVFRARKRGLSRAAQLFVTQLRQVDVAIQARAGAARPDR
jgi:hypothetical protein